MMIDKTIPFTARQILLELEKSPEPLTKREISTNLGVVYQTVNNHFPMLIQRGLIKEVGKIANAMKYTLGDETDSLPRITWKGSSTPIVKLLRTTVAEHELPNEKFSRDILIGLSQLYKWSADALDDDNPRPLKLEQTKKIQTTFARYRQIIQFIDQALKSLLDNGALWDPRDLPRKLIIDDPEMSPEIARSIFENIKEMMEGSAQNNEPN